MAQPPRFTARTRAISDLALSDGAQRLYMLLDDEAHGEPSLHLKQLRIAVALGISTRELQFRLGELEASRYLTIRRTIHGNRYEFVWTDTNACSHPNANAASPRMRTPVREHLYRQEPSRIPPLSPASGGTIRDLLRASHPSATEADLDGSEPLYEFCGWCEGRKFVGRSEKRSKTCEACRGLGIRERRSA